MSEAEKITIVVASDENYLQHLWVMLFSLLEHTNENQNIQLYIIDGGIEESSKVQLTLFFNEKYKLEINFLKVDQSIFKDFKISHHINHVTYYRISIPAILDDSIKKIIYLDCDLVIKDDVKKLWDVDLDLFLIGAVDNPYFNRFSELNINQEQGYFNAGVMVINLELWRKLNISNQVLNFIINNPDKIILWDQDALNAVLTRRWLKLPPRWNQQSPFFDFYFQRFYRDKLFSKEEFEEALSNPAIIHYSAMSKPWEYDNVHPYRAEYYKYLSQTPWSNFQPQPTPKQVFKKIVKQYTPKVIFETAKVLQRNIRTIFNQEL